MKKLIFFLFKAGILLGTIAAFAVAYLVFYYTREIPDYNQLSKYHPPLTTRIYTIDGKLIEQYAKENRIYVPIESLPKDLVNAFIAAEDKNFYTHQGLDIMGIVRASITNIFNIIKNKRLEGASTITQQVVKNLLLTNERSIARKIKEAVLSYMVSKTFTKDQILELYLNQTFFGKGAYGVATAAQTYFNKSAEELSLEEAAFIAGLPKAPSTFDPVKNYQRSKERRDYVINRMLEDGYISVEQAKQALNSQINLKKRDQSDLVSAGYFAEAVRAIVSDMYGANEFYTDGFSVITTLDSKIQKDLNSSFIEGIRLFDRWKGFRKPIAKIKTKDWIISLNNIQEQAGQLEYHLAVILELSDNNAVVGMKDGSKKTLNLPDSKWARSNLKSFKSFLEVGDVIVIDINQAGKALLAQIPSVNGGMLVVDPTDGSIRGYVGGYDFSSNKFDRVIQAQRQPGSSVKTFVYLAALENGVQPNTIYDDAPIELSQGPGMPAWRPKNYKGDFLGNITFRTALEKSRNLVTVRVAKQMGIRKVANTISKLGINSSPPLYYSMILGALETTLSKMVNAYAILANGGYEVAPHFIELIQDKNGKVIYKRNSSNCDNCENYQNGDLSYPNLVNESKKRIIDEESAYQITSILKGAVIRGTSSKLAKYNLPLAAKTGTTNNSYDTWHIAYTPEYVIGTYVGYDNPATMGKTATGATVALPIVDLFLSKISHKLSKEDFPVPENIKLISIDKNSGLPSNDRGAIIEAFKTQNNEYRPMQSEEFDTIGEGDMFDDIIPENEKEEFLENTGEVY